MNIVFDIETRPLPIEELDALRPEFSPADVALGNTKQADKVEEKIKAAEEAWAEKWRENAALSASTSTVLAIGYWRSDVDSIEVHASEDEKSILSKFWTRLDEAKRSRGRLIGFNSQAFDVPFLIRRSWANSIPVPDGVWDGRYLDRCFVDLYVHYKMPTLYGSDPKPMRLGYLAQALRLGCSKLDTGKLLFWELWERDRHIALQYLIKDVECTLLLAERMGILCLPTTK